jgi:hypothetical protein
MSEEDSSLMIMSTGIISPFKKLSHSHLRDSLTGHGGNFPFNSNGGIESNQVSTNHLVPAYPQSSCPPINRDSLIESWCGSLGPSSVSQYTPAQI